jgi:hypothetical protein
MPTAYTADIAKGITFEKFVMNCARAFGACVTMRDDPMDAEIPEEFLPSDYHEKALAKLRKELAELNAMTPQDTERRSVEDWESQERNRAESLQRKADVANAYRAMLGKVNDWTPPTPDHEGLRSFMQQQISDSIKWDCDGSYYERPAEKLSAAAWLAKRLSAVAQDIQYHTEEHEKEVTRCRERSEWVRALRRSLKTEVAVND